MANSNLKRFMRPEMRSEEVFDVVIKDKDGKDMPLKIKRLSQKTITEIRNSYITRNPAYDNKGKPIISNGQLVMIEERDMERYSRHLLVEALVDPKLDDPELMEFFDVLDKVDMPGAVFTPDELSQISEISGALIAYKDIEDIKKEDVEEAKNS